MNFKRRIFISLGLSTIRKTEAFQKRCLKWSGTAKTNRQREFVSKRLLFRPQAINLKTENGGSQKR